MREVTINLILLKGSFQKLRVDFHCTSVISWELLMGRFTNGQQEVGREGVAAAA
jgi:hypothetical protein